MPSSRCWRLITAPFALTILWGCGAGPGAQVPGADGHDHSDRLRTPPHMPEVPPLEGARIATTGTRLVSCRRANAPQALASVRNVSKATADYTVTVSWLSPAHTVRTRAVAMLRSVPPGSERTVALVAAPNGLATRCALHVEYGQWTGSKLARIPAPHKSARDRRLRTPVRATPSNGGVQPVVGNNVRLDANFGRPDGATGRHLGVDIYAPPGEDVLAVTDGTLYSVGTSAVAGNRLWLRDGDGMDFLYTHLGGFAAQVADGTVVQAGQVIGSVGLARGRSTNQAFVHFEAHRAGQPLDPAVLLRRWASSG